MSGIATGFITPLRANAYKKLQLNAGAFLVGFDYASYDNADDLRVALAAAIQDETKLLGVTRGGGSFVVNPQIREPDADGKRYRFKGGAFVDSVDAQLTGTLLEIKPDVFAKILATGEATTNGLKTTIKMHTQILDADYIPSLVWIGDMSDGGVVMIALKNALNNNGMTLTFSDKNEGTIPFEFHAYQDSVEDYDYAPVDIVFLDKVDGSGGITVTPTTNVIKSTSPGNTVVLTARVYGTSGSFAAVSDDTSVATVAATGSPVVSGGITTYTCTVTAVAVGTVSVKITYTPTSGTAVSASAFVRVVSAT